MVTGKDEDDNDSVVVVVATVDVVGAGVTSSGKKKISFVTY